MTHHHRSMGTYYHTSVFAIKFRTIPPVDIFQSVISSEVLGWGGIAIVLQKDAILKVPQSLKNNGFFDISQWQKTVEVYAQFWT